MKLLTKGNQKKKKSSARSGYFLRFAMANEPNPGLFLLGRIAKAQGTLGGFLMDVDDPAAVSDLPELLYLRHPENQWVPYRIEEVRPHQVRKRNVFFVRLEGINTRTEAERLRGHDVMTDKPPGSSPESPDVIGYEAFREDGSQLGEVSDLLETPAYPILIVKTAEKNVLIPWIEQFVSAVNSETHRIITKNTSDLESLE